MVTKNADIAKMGENRIHSFHSAPKKTLWGRTQKHISDPT